ncbi:hypothetical protein TNCV_4324451 [Trichonephila clavipes]|nr:hypothetical protein TNCV_4324451 [Trichonephila clavipes]
MKKQHQEEARKDANRMEDVVNYSCLTQGSYDTQKETVRFYNTRAVVLMKVLVRKHTDKAASAKFTKAYGTGFRRIDWSIHRTTAESHLHASTVHQL